MCGRVSLYVGSVVWFRFDQPVRAVQEEGPWEEQN